MKQIIFNSDKYTFFLEHVYLEYEGPLFFLCEDIFGSKYLAAASECDEEKETWTLAKVSSERLAEVISNRTTLFDIYRCAEDGQVYIVSSYRGLEIDNIEVVPSSEIAEKLLPAKGEYLNLSEEDLRDFKYDYPANDDKFLSSAKARMVTVTELEIIENGRKYSHAIPVAQAGSILTSFESFRLSTLLPQGKKCSRITSSTYKGAETVLVGTKAASIVFVMESESAEIIEDKVSISCDAIHRLLEAGGESHKIDPLLEEFNPAVISWYKAFLNEIMRYGASLSIRTAFPGEQRISKIALSQDQLALRKQFLDQKSADLIETLTVSGLLFGFEQARRLFSFIPDDSEEPICGKIEESAAESYRDSQIIVNSHGKIYLTKTTKFSLESEDGKVYYIMNSFIKDEE